MQWGRSPGLCCAIPFLVCIACEGRLIAGAREFRQGDRAIVSIGPAPVKDDVGRPVGTLSAGAQVKVVEVEGSRVKVRTEGQAMEGWVQGMYLRAPSATGQQTTPAPKATTETPRPAPPQPSAEPVGAQASQTLTAVLRRMASDIALRKAKPGTIGLSDRIEPYALTKLPGSEVEAWLVAGSCEVIMASGLDPANPGANPNDLRLGDFRAKKVVLYFPGACRVGPLAVEARSLLRLADSGQWEKVTTPDALSKLAGYTLAATLQGDSSAAKLLSSLGDTAMEAVPQLIGRLSSRGTPGSFAALEALQGITGEGFGADAAKWRKWWQERGPAKSPGAQPKEKAE